MKPAPLLVFIPLLFPLAALGARPLTKPEVKADGRYEFRDGSRLVKFRIATDELQESGGGVHRRVPVTARGQLQKIQETAKEMSRGRKFDLVAYPEGKPQTEANRRVVTNKVSVTLDEGIDPTSIGLAINALTMKPLVYLPYDYVMTFADATEAITAAEALKSVPGVLKSEVLLARQLIPAFIPSDPLFQYSGKPFFTNIGDDLAEGFADFGSVPVLIGQANTRAYQWYLNGEASLLQLPKIIYARYEDRDLPPWQDPNVTKEYPRYFESVIDLNVIPAWDEKGAGGKPVDGAGVRIGLLDDGVQLNPLHPDLNRDNMLFSDDFNYLDGTAAQNDPTPPGTSAINSHGTAVAGLILAKRNDLQMTGVAPGAKLAAYRVAGGFIDGADFADAMVFKAERLATPVTPSNPLGIPTGNEWRSGPVRFDVGCIPLTDPTYGADLYGLNLYLRKALAYGVNEGRNGLGVVYVVPAGNDGEEHGDTNYGGLTNSIYTIKVGSVTDLGRRAAYSTPGASLHVVAPSSGGEITPRLRIVGTKLEPTMVGLTDPVPDKTLPPTFYGPAVPDTAWRRAMGYTIGPDNYDSPLADRRNTQQLVSLRGPDTTNENFGGTSAACALATGVVALMLEANPNLGWRDVQEILMRSAAVVDETMGEWQYNPLGMPMSHKYGAGVIDAAHAVRMAKIWKNLGPRFGPVGGQIGSIGYKEIKGESYGNQGANRVIQDNPATVPPIIPTKAVTEITMSSPSSGLRIEHVVVRMKVTHGRRGDLGIILTAPSTGQADRPVESYLMIPHREDVNPDIGLPDEINTGGDGGEIEGEYWDFSTVRHWGTNSQNAPLGGTGTGTEGWKLTVWDNTNKGKVNTQASITAAKLKPDSNPEDRIFVGVDNPTSAAKIVYAEIRYHGTLSASENEPPVITTGEFKGITKAAFKKKITAESDLSPNPIDNTPRAPVYNYRVRVLKTLTANTPDLVIAPSTPRDYRLSFPIIPPETTPPPVTASLRFDREKGILSNEPYPAEAIPDPTYPIPPFVPLPKGSWQLELQATSILGSTRKLITFTVDDPLKYPQWKSTKFFPAELANPEIGGDNADPDGDGIPNLMEYGMGGEPKKNESKTLSPVTTIQGDRLVYRYTVDTSAQEYVITPQVSSDLDPLDTWTSLTPTLIDFGQIVTAEVSVKIEPGQRKFVRLRIAKP